MLVLALSHLHRWLTTRRCRACRARYARRLPNCPRCKTKPGQEHDLPRSHEWAANLPMGMGGFSGGGGC